MQRYNLQPGQRYDAGTVLREGETPAEPTLIPRRRLGGSLALPGPLPIRPRRGFSFTEILFAVMVLGIGFIMVAALFPVAIKQTQATGEETVAATIAKGGVSCIQQYASKVSLTIKMVSPTPDVYADGIVHPIGPATSTPVQGPLTNIALWPLISGNMIIPSDPRYGWVAMYRQTTGSNYAQIIIIAVQTRNRTGYTPADLSGNSGASVPSLQARPLNAVYTAHTATAPDLMTFSDISGNTGVNSFIGCVSEGSFVVVANDGQGNSTNGFVYRLGVARPDIAANTFELAPGNDTLGANAVPPIGPAFQVLVVGSGYSDLANPANGYSGPAQDVAVYSTFVTLGG